MKTVPSLNLCYTEEEGYVTADDADARVRASLGDAKSPRWVTRTSRWVTLRARWVTLRALAG
jgi:hypothetical protein